MEVGYKLMVLGARYERANIKRNFASMKSIETELAQLERDNPEVWCGAHFVQGRNFINKLHNNSTYYAL